MWKIFFIIGKFLFGWIAWFFQGNQIQPQIKKQPEEVELKLLALSPQPVANVLNENLNEKYKKELEAMMKWCHEVRKRMREDRQKIFQEANQKIRPMLLSHTRPPSAAPAA